MKNLKEKFLEKARAKFGDKYEYPGEYISSTQQITVVCPIHGAFKVTPKGHLQSKTGCNKCARQQISESKKIDGQKRKDMKEYRIWKAMKTRVSNPNTKCADSYVNKGIKCCEQWLNSFEQFYKDMGPCPEGYSIDRIDNNGDYTPENCRWASSKEQADNRGEFNKVFEHNGEAHVLKDWAKILGIKYTTLYQRIYRSNLSFEQAIQQNPFEHTVIYKGERKSLKELCNQYNMEYSVVYNRLYKHGWDIEEALTIPKGKRRPK